MISENILKGFCTFSTLLLLLLSYATWEVKSPYSIETGNANLRQRTTREQCEDFEKQCECTMAAVWLQPLSIDGRAIHLHLWNFDLSLMGREIFSRESTRGKLLKTDHGTFRTTDFTSTNIACILWVFVIIWNRMWDLWSDTVTTRFPTPFLLYIISANCSDFLQKRKSIFTPEKLFEISLWVKSRNKDGVLTIKIFRREMGISHS